MIVITILAGLAAIAAAFGLVRFIQNAVDARYGYRPITKITFGAFCGGFMLIIWGQGWYLSATKNHGDTLNGVMLMLLGATLLGWVVYRNIKRTTLAAGVGITAVQVPIFAVMAYLGIFVLAIAIALIMIPGVFRAISPPVVRIIP